MSSSNGGHEHSEEDFNVDKKFWIKIEDQFYDVEEIVIKFNSAGLNLENDVQ